MHTCNYKLSLANMVRVFTLTEESFSKEVAKLPWYRPFLKARAKGAQQALSIMLDESYKMLQYLSAIDHSGPKPQGGANA